MRTFPRNQDVTVTLKSELVAKKSLQGSKFDVIIRKKLFRNTPDVIKSGVFKNSDTASKKVSVGSKNLTLEQKCKNKVCRY